MAWVIVLGSAFVLGGIIYNGGWFVSTLAVLAGIALIFSVLTEFVPSATGVALWAMPIVVYGILAAGLLFTMAGLFRGDIGPGLALILGGAAFWLVATVTHSIGYSVFAAEVDECPDLLLALPKGEVICATGQAEPFLWHFTYEMTLRDWKVVEERGGPPLFDAPRCRDALTPGQEAPVIPDVREVIPNDQADQLLPDSEEGILCDVDNDLRGFAGCPWTFPEMRVYGTTDPDISLTVHAFADSVPEGFFTINDERDVSLMGLDPGYAALVTACQS